MPKDEPVGKTVLVEQRTLSGTQEKKECYDLWKKVQATQEDYKSDMSSAGRKFEKGSKPNYNLIWLLP